MRVGFIVECHRDGADHKVIDPKKRPACYDAANQKHARCRRRCEKDFPEE